MCQDKFECIGHLSKQRQRRPTDKHDYIHKQTHIHTCTGTHAHTFKQQNQTAHQGTSTEASTESCHKHTAFTLIHSLTHAGRVDTEESCSWEKGATFPSSLLLLLLLVQPLSLLQLLTLLLEEWMGMEVAEKDWTNTWRPSFHTILSIKSTTHTHTHTYTHTHCI